MFGYNDRSGPQNKPTTKVHEEIQTRQEQMLHGHQICKMINDKNEVNGLIGYFF